jgi:glycolate oxidase iron-sulfur subunit
VGRLARWLARETLPYPGRFRAAALAGRLGRPLAGLMPAEIRAMLRMLPEGLPAAQALPRVAAAQGPRRARVALLAGCVQQALGPEINAATLKVLTRNGVEVVIPPGQGCCGSLMAHRGEAREARRLARRNLRAFPRDVDAVVTNAAGCGSGMREYGLLFAGQPEEAEARAFAGRVRDVSEFLDALGLAEAPGPLARPLRLAYHDACHLAHAQGVAAAPRRLLGAIPNVTLVEVPEGEVCCGSAGTYNLEQPEIAAALGRRKAENVLSTGCEAVAAGNIGCLVQMRAHLGGRVRAAHTMEVLAEGYR